MAIVKRNPRTAWRQYEGTVLIITTDDRMIHRLNTTASVIWNALGDDGKEQVEIIALLEREFDCPQDTLAQQILDFIHKGVAAGFIVVE